MPDLNAMIVSQDMSAVRAMAAIDRAGSGIVFVCESGKVLATLTDGDIRRHILHGGALDTPVSDIANFHFHSARADEMANIPEILRTYRISSVPVLDDNGMLLSVYFADDRPIRYGPSVCAPVVIMAGGRGTRLGVYTKILPKPLIPLGDDTITDLIIKQFTDCGCRDFWMIVNYKKEMIRAYFAEPSTEYAMHFVNEDKPLGTAGGLSLLGSEIRETFFLTNCDILVAEHMGRIYEHHKRSGNLLTMVCATKNAVFPYGTVTVDNDGRVTAITEKPNFPLLTNSGVYVVEPEFLSYVPEHTFIHITDIIDRCVHDGQRIGVYPVSEAQWSDMGQLDELESTRRELGL